MPTGVGFHLSHQTVHNWCQIFGAELGMKLRDKRKFKCGKELNIDIVLNDSLPFLSH